MGGFIRIKGYPNSEIPFRLPTVVGISEIKCITELDEGSDNQGSGGTLKGLIYGKEYEFKISKYYKDRSLSEEMKKEITWEYAYNNGGFKSQMQHC